MIPYSINSEIRKMVIVIITLLSFTITTMLDGVWTKVTNLIHNSPVIESVLTNRAIVIVGDLIFPSFMSFIFIYLIYCKLLWSKRFFYKMHKIPNLNGKWKGKSISNGKSARDVDVTITQDWNKIFIETTLTDTNSICRCTVVAIEVNDIETKIKYAYTNPELEEGNKYVGYNELRIRNNKVNGGYFTNKPSKGIFDITRG